RQDLEHLRRLAGIVDVRAGDNGPIALIAVDAKKLRVPVELGERTNGGLHSSGSCKEQSLQFLGVALVFGSKLEAEFDILVIECNLDGRIARDRGLYGTGELRFGEVSQTEYLWLRLDQQPRGVVTVVGRDVEGSRHFL